MTVNRIARLAPRQLVLIFLLLTGARLARADDPACMDTGGTGAAIVNDNGKRAPFIPSCDAVPVIHVYSCERRDEMFAAAAASAATAAELWLGSTVCQCHTSAGSCPPCATASFSATIPWCGGEYDNRCEDGLTVTPSSTDGWYDFTIRYRALRAVSPVILLRIGRLGEELVERWPGPWQSDSPGVVVQPVKLAAGKWDVQLTLYDKLDCLPHLPNQPQEVYWGGETENYELCLGPSCSTRLHGLRSNH